jgi:hypothetical protein
MKARVIENQSVLLRCAGLQVLDLVTTLLFLAHGVEEANPFVKWSMAASHGNLGGLLAVKFLACILALTAVQSGRTFVVVRMNRFFSFLVIWNLLALGLSFGSH